MSLTGRFQRGRLVVRFDPAAFPRPEELLAVPVDELEAQGELREVHTSRGARVFRSRDGRPVPFFWKEFRSRGGWDAFKSAWRRSRARRALDAGERLTAAGLAAPRPLALGEAGPLGSRHRAFLVTEAVTGLESLTQWAQPGRLTAAERRRLVAALGDAIGRLHRAGLVHGDLRPSNLLTDRDGARIVLLDNERTRRSLRRKERMRNLVQLGVDQLGRPYRTDRLRFLRAYLQAHPGSAASFDALIREVEAALRARRARRSNRGLDPLTGLEPGRP